MSDSDEIDEALGITRCLRCGHRLEGEIDCPFCSVFPGNVRKPGVAKWIFITACFLTSPLSLYAIITSRQLNVAEKTLTFSGCLFWLGIYQLF